MLPYIVFFSNFPAPFFNFREINISCGGFIEEYRGFRAIRHYFLSFSLTVGSSSAIKTPAAPFRGWVLKEKEVEK